MGRVVELVAVALTMREREVAENLLEAKSDRDISLSLGISEDVVTSRLRGMCHKARIPNDRVTLALLLLGYPRRADLKNLRCRRELLLGFRGPGRPPASVSPRARKSRAAG